MRKKTEQITNELSDAGSEKAVLAGLFQYGTDAYIDVNTIISTDTFTIVENKFIYKVFEIILQESDSIDETSIIATAKRLGYDKEILVDKDSIDHLRAILTFPINLENVAVHAKRIAKLEFVRVARFKLKKAYDDLSAVTGSETIEQIVSIPETVMFDIIESLNKEQQSNPELLGVGLDEMFEMLMNGEQKRTGIPTPFKEFNAAIGGGCRRGGVNLVCSRPKKGKTTIAKEVALFVASNDIPVLILDTEMNKNDQVFRSLSSMSGVKITNIENGYFCLDPANKRSVMKAKEDLQKKPVYYVSIAGKPFEEILSIIRRWILKTVGKDDETGVVNDCLVIYDYFKVMDTSELKELKEYQLLGFQISRLSDFAKYYDFACLAFTQLNREEDISQSDRLRWLAHSYSRLIEKTQDEINLEGLQNGNRRLMVEDARYGPGLDGGTIDFMIHGDITAAEELGLSKEREKRAKAQQIKNVTGFETTIEDECPFGDNDDPTNTSTTVGETGD